MSIAKLLLIFAVVSTEVVNGCLRHYSIACYKCNSQDSPLTCDEGNFNASVHAYDRTEISGKSCVQGWATNNKGLYYYRDKSSGYEDNVCKSQKCYCDWHLCNSKDSPALSVTTKMTLLLITLLGIALSSV